MQEILNMKKLSFLTPKFFSRYIDIYKKEGFKGVYQEGGRKVLVLVFLFFLIKGIIWLIILFYGGKGIFNMF